MIVRVLKFWPLGAGRRVSATLAGLTPVAAALAVVAGTGAQAGSAVPDAVLGSVACSSSSLCIAVGDHHGRQFDRALAEKWNGSAWRGLSPLSPRSNKNDDLGYISCGSPRVCFAVGTFGTGLPGVLIEMWNGHIWSVLAVGQPRGAETSRLRAVSCAGPSACFAVGEENDNTDIMPTALVEHWNGSRWSIQSTPIPKSATAVGLNGVSCVAPTDCTAVGVYGLPSGKQKVLVEHYNGTSWTIELAPSPPSSTEPMLDRVGCSGADCVAVGTTLGAPFAEAFNGHTWSIVPLAKPAGAAYLILEDVKCASATDCYAVGSSQTSGGAETTLVEQWNGTSWAVMPSPDAAGATDSVLWGVSCPGVGSCMAVGSYEEGTGLLTLAMQLADGTWTILPTRSPS